ncbi:MAG: Omp28-related outer membrane protein, partial [bacterium]
MAGNLPALGDTVVCIQFHTWWPGPSDPFYQANISENTARTNYYQPGSKYVPRAFIDGVIDGQLSYSQWGNFIRGRHAVDAPLTIELQGAYPTVPPNDGMVRVLVEALDFLSFSDLRLFTVITEDGIFFAGPNGTLIHDQTMRDMIPASTGEPVGLSSPGDTLLRDYNFTIDGTWVDDSCNVVVFIQDYATKEILQAAVSRITDLQIGVEERGGRCLAPRFALLPGYPNPFMDRARISYAIPSTGRVGLRIYDSAGNLVRTL